MARPLVRRRSDLPPSLTSLIGREQEIADVIALYERATARLVSLTGPGGIGKTRLALAVAEQLDERFPDGVWFVQLAPVADPNLVLSTIAQALGAAEQGDHAMLARLTELLRERRGLLLLDNFEHVIAVAPEIAQLLMACPGLHVLVTSRESLRLQGEHEYAVPPLGTDQRPAGALLENDAARLFVERARQASPGFEIDEINAPVINEICRRLDGLPLALELAAARIKVLSPDDLLARLDQPLAILTGGPRDAPTRQQTIRDTLLWSYDLLSPDEQRLFRRMAVFAGGCSLAAVEAIAENGDALEPLSSLVDKSLVRRVERPAHSTRYEMLEPVRQFAWELLTACEDEADHARQLHALHYVSLTEGVRRQFDGPDGPAVFERVETEHDNLRAALRWLRESEQIELGLRLIHALGIFWILHGHIDEGRIHAQAFLSAPDGQRRTVARARALWPASWLWLARGDIDATLPMIEEAYSIAEEHDDHYSVGHTLNIRGICHFNRGNKGRAQLDWERALRIFREEAEDDAMVVRVLFNLAHLTSARGDLDQSRAILEEALELARACELTMVTATALTVYANVEARSGNDDRAVGIYVECMGFYQQLGIPKGVADSLAQLALIAQRKGCHERAVCLYGTSSALRELSGFALRSIPDYPDIDGELPALRAVLPEAIFQAAWERGRGMSMNEAVEYAAQSIVTPAHEPVSTPLDGLTPRETEVLGLIARRMSNREIAEELFISSRTVERHIENLYRKLDIHNRLDAIDLGRRHMS